MRTFLMLSFLFLVFFVKSQSRDPRSKDQANVYWDGKYPLYSLVSDKQILPDQNGNYNYWSATNENPTPVYKTSKKGGVQYVYKFIDYSECYYWCVDYRKATGKPTIEPARIVNSRDVKTYKTVKIGNQTWMTENLNVSTFRNGDPIPEARSWEEWTQALIDKSPAWCYYENNEENGVKYGKLYNWHAVMDPRGLAPAGWHVPTSQEWEQLGQYFGGADNAGNKLKSYTNDWENNGYGTNESNFNGLPGGCRDGDFMTECAFIYKGTHAYWWSSSFIESPSNGVYSYITSLEGNNKELSISRYFYGGGNSVRCISDTPGGINNSSTSVISSTNSNSNQESDTKTETKIYQPTSFKTVNIGNQVWFSENLDVTSFRNGDPIIEAKTVEEWKQAIDNGTPAWCYYNNDSVLGKKFGKLYNSFAVNDSRGLAPEGFHIPTKNEWKTLESFIGKVDFDLKVKSTNGWEPIKSGGPKIEVCPNCKSWNREYRTKVACHKCRDTREITVNYPVVFTPSVGKNSSGFNALPGGYRVGFDEPNPLGSPFYGIGFTAIWWTSDRSTMGVDAIFKNLGFIPSIEWVVNEDGEVDGYSVRCIKN